MSDEVNLQGYRLEVYVDPEDGSWVAEAPDLPGCVAAGTTYSEAVERVADAIEAWIAAARADGGPVPQPSIDDDEYSGRFLLRLPKGLHRQLARQARRERVSLNQYCSNALAQFVAIGQFSEGLARTYVYDASRAFLTNRPLTTTVYAASAAREEPAWSRMASTVGNRGAAFRSRPEVERVA